MTMKYKNIEEFGEDFQQKYGAEYGYIWSVKNKKWTIVRHMQTLNGSV